MRRLSYLPLLEGLPCQVSPTGALEQGEITLGLLIPLLLQLGQGAGSEEQLEQSTSKQMNLLAMDTIHGRLCNAYFSQRGKLNLEGGLEKQNIKRTEF